MNVIGLQLIVILAGMINGAFALPSKYIKNWRFEHIWLSFSILAFLLLPLVTVVTSGHHTWSLYVNAPTSMIAVILLGGIAFGIGQCCFALALDCIGFGLGFLINIGLGTALGFAFPLIALHPSHLLTVFGAATLTGTVMIIIGLLFAYWAGQIRDNPTSTEQAQHRRYTLGVILAVIAGLFSATQNCTFAFTAPLQQLALNAGMSQLSAATVIWPGFLLAAWLPYAGFMLHKLIRNRGAQPAKQFTGSGLNLMYAGVMALFWYGSLMLYSYVSINLGPLGPVIAWPLFMVTIVLTSNLLGWQQGEWSAAPKNAKTPLIAGLLFLITAFIVLAWSMTLPH